MVISYLEKIRDKFLEEKVELSSKFTLILNEQKETVEFIKVLEVNDDPTFEAFTPRQVNSFNKTKIIELRERLKVLDSEIAEYQDAVENKEKEIEEVTLIIKQAKEMMK